METHIHTTKFKDVCLFDSAGGKYPNDELNYLQFYQ